VPHDFLERGRQFVEERLVLRQAVDHRDRLATAPGASMCSLATMRVGTSAFCVPGFEHLQSLSGQRQPGHTRPTPVEYTMREVMSAWNAPRVRSSRAVSPPPASALRRSPVRTKANGGFAHIRTGTQARDF
jgi:hypothetical protein